MYLGKLILFFELEIGQRMSIVSSSSFSHWRDGIISQVTECQQIVNNGLARRKMPSSAVFVHSCNVNILSMTEFSLLMRCWPAGTISKILTIASHFSKRQLQNNTVVVWPNSTPHAGLWPLECWLCDALELILEVTKTTNSKHWQNGTFRSSALPTVLVCFLLLEQNTWDWVIYKEQRFISAYKVHFCVCILRGELFICLWFWGLNPGRATC